MAYRNVSYGFLHAAQLSTATLTANQTVHADWPIGRLIDNRPGALMKQNASSSAHDYRIDRGAGTLESLTHAIIPAGHNLDTMTVQLFDSAVGFGTSETSRGSVVVSGAGLVELELSTASTQRYVRVDIVGTGTWEIGQLFLTNKREPSTGVSPEWSRLPEPQVDSAELATHIATVTLGANRNRWRLSHFALEGADLTIYDDMAGACLGNGFLYVWPPGDDSLPPVFVQLVDVRAFDQDFTVPSLSETYTVELELLEVSA